MKSLKSAAFTALLAPALLLADADPNHVAVGTRPISEEENLFDTAGFIFDRYPMVQLSKSHHYLLQIIQQDKGDYLLKLEDDSSWKVNSYDGENALNWRVDDPLIITQNHRWFSSYSYRLINAKTGASVETNLSGGPLKNGPRTLYIAQIASDQKELKLTDGTYWEISYLDSSVFKGWEPSHAIILGTNSGWDSSCEALLINVTLNNRARAKPF